MRIMAIAAGALLASVAATASAQVYYDRAYTHDPYAAPRAEWRGAGDECWNPRAGHFEGVRPGEVQNDLDFARCRPASNRSYADGNRYYGDGYSYYADGNRNFGDSRRDRRDWRQNRQECWNPRAGHFEDVRPGEHQNDLDFSRCRIARW